MKIAYVIPAYNEGRALEETLRELRAKAPEGRIIVVDDGSRDSMVALARRFGASALRHLVNRGQGAALQTGIDAALLMGAECVVTYDADGQHNPEDVWSFVQALESDPRLDCVLGSRFLGDAEQVPNSRKVLLFMALLFTWVLSRVRVTDTHNGFRVFRSTALRRIRITEDRMAHASEILDLIRRHGLRYRELPCRFRYTEYSRSKGQTWRQAPRIAWDVLIGKLFR